MLSRILHGWIIPENAKKYEELLKTKMFPSIKDKKIKRYRKISLL